MYFSGTSKYAMLSHSFNQDFLRRPDTMPKVKPRQSRKGKTKAPKTTTQRDQSSSTGLSADAEQALIDKIANSVVDKLIKGGHTTEHEGEEHFNVNLVHSHFCFDRR
jgi:N-formylglutamate amidohydrolase